MRYALGGEEISHTWYQIPGMYYGVSSKGLYVDLSMFREALRSARKASLAHIRLFVFRAHVMDDAKTGGLS